MKRRKAKFAVLAAVVIVLLVYLIRRPRTIASFDSPDGRWQLVVSDIDPNPYQVTAEFAVRRRGAWSQLPGEPCQVYNDSSDPFLGTPEWSDHGVRIMSDRGTRVGALEAEFGEGRQIWNQAPPTTVPAP